MDMLYADSNRWCFLLCWRMRLGGIMSNRIGLFCCPVFGRKNKSEKIIEKIWILTKKLLSLYQETKQTKL
jgi:hypothetical protein